MTARKLAKAKPARGGRRHGLSPEGASVRLSVCLPPHLAAWVAREASRSDRTQAEIVRVAVAMQWATQKEKENA